MHDPRIAAGAPRLMQMADGKITESGEVNSSDGGELALAEEQSPWHSFDGRSLAQYISSTGAD